MARKCWSFAQPCKEVTNDYSRVITEENQKTTDGNYTCQRKLESETQSSTPNLQNCFCGDNLQITSLSFGDLDNGREYLPRLQESVFEQPLHQDSPLLGIVEVSRNWVKSSLCRQHTQSAAQPTLLSVNRIWRNSPSEWRIFQTTQTPQHLDSLMLGCLKGKI